MQEFVIHFASWFGEPFVVGGEVFGMRRQAVSLALTIGLPLIIGLSVLWRNRQ